MSIDEQIVDMLRDRFDAVDKKLDEAKDAFAAHSESDQKYWAVIDKQQNQLDLIRRVFWGCVTLGTAVAGWFGVKH